MLHRQIVNIINFIRDVEPRLPTDLVTPVREQIRLMKELSLRGTFLIQYDALIDPVYQELLKPLDPAQFEIGVWFETVQPQVEAAGLVWRGRFPWDWHANCGFSVGYTKPEREKLVDVLYEKFREVFGYYPRIFGSWFFDSHTVRYAADKYGMDALCNCKEQYGTDGYTLWGGYYGQGYYPSRRNVFMPARDAEDQLNVPLFRMLGSDPVYQYDFGTDPETGSAAVQGVITLEPVYTGNTGGGGVPSWVDWYLKENFNGDCLSFGYAQAGQENSFSWPGMKDGLTHQFHELARLQAEGKLTVEPLGDTGRWYKETYDYTPASAIVAHTAFDDPERRSVWYSTKNYRVNLYADHGTLRIRDLHIFDAALTDPYEDTVATTNEAVYDTLPVIDGNRYTGAGILAGGYLSFADGSAPQADTMTFEELGSGCARVTFGEAVFELNESGITIRAAKPFVLENRIGVDGGHLPTTIARTEDTLTLSYRGVQYSVRLAKGRFLNDRTMESDGCELVMELAD